MKKLFSSYLKFIFAKRQYILYGLVLFVIIGVFVGLTNGKPLKANQPTFWEDITWWSKWLDPILGTAVFLLTVVIGWTQLREDWEEDLEKRLTVIFRLNGREVMICKKAYLTAEGDIRNLGQQIGLQMNDNKHLKFKANDIESKRLGVERSEFQNKHLVHYRVEFELTALPENPNFQTANLIWHEPDNNKIKEKEEWVDLVLEVKEDNEI